MRVNIHSWGQNNFTTSQSIYPIMAYSNNINGGNLNSSIQVGDLTFIGNKEYNAKSGLIFGGGFSLKSKLFKKGWFILSS